MNRKLGLFLIISFLSVQMLSFLHMAEHGFEDHEHEGQVCEIYLFSEHTKYSYSSEVITVQVPEYFAFTIGLPELTFVHSTNYRNTSPRAPPLFS